MTEILDWAMTIFTGGTFGTMLFLAFRVGHLQGCLTKVVTICEYLNHRTTAIEESMTLLLMSQGGGAVMVKPPIVGRPPEAVPISEPESGGNIQIKPRRLRTLLRDFMYRNKGGETNGRKRRDRRKQHRDRRQ